MDKNITATDVLPALSYSYELVIEKDCGKVFLLPDQDTLICELTKKYVPIKEFKEIFVAISPIIEKHNIKKFVFDKQNLAVFHQLSMEWYFVHWKKDMYALGMKTHRKILPKDNLSFKMAVEAGRFKIATEFKNTVVDKLDIQYKSSIQEAIAS